MVNGGHGLSLRTPRVSASIGFILTFWILSLMSKNRNGFLPFINRAKRKFVFVESQFLSKSDLWFGQNNTFYKFSKYEATDDLIFPHNP